MTLPSAAGRERGWVFPLAGGSCEKSMYSPARMLSLVFLGMDGIPYPSDICGLGVACCPLLPEKVASSSLMAGSENG